MVNDIIKKSHQTAKKPNAPKAKPSPKIQRINRESLNKQPAKGKDLPPRPNPIALKSARTSAATSAKKASVSSGPIPSLKPQILKKPPRGKITKLLQKRTSRIAVSSVAILVTLGLVIWLTLPALSLKLASTKSGVNASLPYYVPDGYHLNLPIKATENQAIVSYYSRRTNDKLTLIQEKSLWDSQAVRQMVDEKSNGRYLTLNDRGLTIYTYSGNAAWVNKGILYQIQGSDKLSSDVLTQIAGSL